MREKNNVEIYYERQYKISCILEKYNERKTQEEVADCFGMDIKEVSKVTQKMDILIRDV